MKSKLTFWAASAINLGACTTPVYDDGMTSINTAPQGAVVTLSDGFECISPCSIALSVPTTLKIAKAGFLSQSVTIAPSERNIIIALELAAPTEQVQSSGLPDL